MYGGPPRPNPSLYQGRSRPFSPNFRPRFGNTGFPSSQHGIHPSQFGDFGPRQPCPPARSPFGKNPPPWGQEQVFQPKGGQMQGLRSGFRPTGFQPQRRHKVREVKGIRVIPFLSTTLTSKVAYKITALRILYFKGR